MNCGDASKKSHFVSPPGEVTGHHDIFGTKGYRDVGCFYTGNPGRGKCDAFTGFVSAFLAEVRWLGEVLSMVLGWIQIGMIFSSWT